MPKKTITVPVREIEVLIETLIHRGKTQRAESMSSACLLAAEDLRDLLRRHDALLEPAPPEDPEDT